MARTVLDKELQELDEQILRLGSLVDDALAKALDSLETGDIAKAGLVIEADAGIDILRAAIEEHTIRLLTLQQPLGGRDLRYLASALSIAGDLERTGDGAAGIAQNILCNASRAIADRKSTRLNSSHGSISYAVFCLKKKNNTSETDTQLSTR